MTEPLNRRHDRAWSRAVARGQKFRYRSSRMGSVLPFT
jgi:hypothetical protein